MRKTTENLIRLNAVFVTGLVISNVVAGKIVSIFGLTVPAAVVAYAMTFLCTDIIGEIWGKEQANKTVLLGFACQVAAMGLIMIALWLPYAPFAEDMRIPFETVLGQNLRFVLASLAAYTVSQSWDVFVFHRIREKTGEGKKWLRNNIGTMTSQVWDTVIFITIAFWGSENLIQLIIGQYTIKVILAAIDTPFFYMFTRRPAVEANP